MVCHQTYKDKNNNWLTPEEVFTEDGKNFFIKNTLRESKGRAFGSMSKSKKYNRS